MQRNTGLIFCSWRVRETKKKWCDVSAKRKIPDIADSIISVGKKCRDIGVRNAIIFSLERRRSPRLQAKISEFNDVLMDLCTIEGFVFIHNANLSNCDTCEELLHLSYSRSCKLKNDFICVIKRNLEKVVFDKAMWATQNMNLYLKLKNHQKKQSLNANNIFSNLKVRINNKLIIGNLNLNSVAGKFDQLKLMVQYKTYLPYLFLPNLYETQKPSMWNCWFRKLESIFVSVELVCLSQFLFDYDAKNIDSEKTCFKSKYNSNCIDLFIINSPDSFQDTSTITTGLSDFHKTVFKSYLYKN